MTQTFEPSPQLTPEQPAPLSFPTGIEEVGKTGQESTVHRRRAPGEEMSVAMSRIAVAHPLNPHLDESVPLLLDRAEGGHEYRHVIHTGADSPEIPGMAKFSPASEEKRDVMIAVRNVVGLHGLGSISHTREGEEPAIRWAVAADSLLEGSRSVVDEKDKHAQLVGAVMAVQFAENDQDRIEFVRKVYDQGIEKDMADACRSSDILLLTDGPGFSWGSGESDVFVSHPVRHYARVFEMTDPKRVANYLHYLEDRRVGDENRDLPSAKRLHKELSARDPLDPETEATREQAEQVAVDSEQVNGALIDAYKIERFALQSVFIRDQAQALFGSDLQDLTNSPFARKLAELRTREDGVVDPEELKNYAVFDHTSPSRLASPEERIALASGRLEAQVTGVFEELSGPVVGKYSLEGVDLSSPDKLTEAQRAAWRFRIVMEQLRQHNAVSQFVNFEAFATQRPQEIVADFEDDREIWTSSQDGAAVPPSINNAIQEVMLGALRAVRAGQTPPTPAELRDLMQRDRRRLLRVAAHNIAEISAVSDGASYTDVELQRTDQGELQMTAKGHVAQKDSLDVYAAITLGCPALHIVHPSRQLLSAEQRLAHGSSNYIDHALAAVINEAYERGLLNLSIYTAS